VVSAPSPARQSIRFGPFELDLRSRELRKEGRRVSLQDQPFQVLVVLLERPGELVGREELRARLWPADTYVDFEHGLNAAIKRLRDALGDSSDQPRYVETVPRRGYRFVGAVDRPRSYRPVRLLTVGGAMIGVVAAAAMMHVFLRSKGSSREATTERFRFLTRLTFARGLQTDPTWSPDGRYVAYTSDQSGNFDIWVQPVAGGEAVRLTSDQAHDWQPDWSPDGSLIAFRSERQGGGLYVVPALGGYERRLTAFGFLPRWAPNGSRLLFTTTMLPLPEPPTMFTVDLQGNPPREVLRSFLSQFEAHGVGFQPPAAMAWHPDGRVSFWGMHREDGDSFWTVNLDGTSPIRSAIEPAVNRRLGVDPLAAADLRLMRIGERIRWNPAGTALYFSACPAFGSSVINLWKVDVDPTTLRWIGGPDRVTTGSGEDQAVALSPDARRLAFGTQTTVRQIVSFPLASEDGAGDGRVVHTPAEISAYGPDVTRDGRTLAFGVYRFGGKGGWELRTRSLTADRERLLLTWGPPPESLEFRSVTRWSPDSAQLAYAYSRWDREGSQVRIVDARTGAERPVTSFLPMVAPSDWSGDGKYLLMTASRDVGPLAIWRVPLGDAPEAERTARSIASDPHYALWQARFSPDDRWVVFTANLLPGKSAATLYVIPSFGGPWRQVTEGRYFDDKPRWSPDGRTIYFVSSRDGTWNVWSVGFDPDRGLVTREPRRVTALGGPGRTLLTVLDINEIAISNRRVFLCLQEVSGALWTLGDSHR
jgi:Tol biopolymer transport system component/DNA-binding winged helix-turn-helix (wHTH) protein